MERQILAHYPNGILGYFDHDLRYLRVDGEELRRTGRTPADMEGKTIWEIYPPEVAAHIEPYHRRVLAGESVCYEASVLDETYFVQAEPVVVHGEVVGGVFSTQETNELLAKLARVGEEQRTLLENLPGTVVAILDRELRYVQVSRSIEVAGWRGEELIGRPIAETLRDRPETLALFEAALAGEPQSIDHRGVDGSRDYWLQVVPLRRGDAVYGVMSIAQDMTERKGLERELAEKRRAESLGVLAGGVAHDFNNLLQGILGHTELALVDLPFDSPARERLASVLDASQHAARLAGLMLAYSGHGGMLLAEVDVSELVRESYAKVAVPVGAGERVRFDLQDDLPPTRGDTAQLAEVPARLIENAIEANGSVVVSTGVTPGHVYVEVADDGEGMTEEVTERMFEPFFTTRFTGRGLGLAAVQGIVRGHGGRITVESAPGEGTVVRVELPVAA